MTPIRRLWSLATPLAGLLLALGCATWRPYQVAPNPPPGQSLPYRLRATRIDGSRVALTAPFVRADSLYGRERGDTVGLPLTDIVHMERQRTSVWRTAAVLVGVPVIGSALAYLIACGSSGCQPTYLIAE
jgi:hypothetical protein